MSRRIEIEAFSADTGVTYENWAALLKAEANGFVVIGVSDNEKHIPVVAGPFKDEEAARKAQPRLRKKWRASAGSASVRTYIRVLWKEKP